MSTAVVLWTTLVGPACAPLHTPVGVTDRDYVVLVSFDGFRRDYLDRYDTPHFDALGNSGIVADALIPVFPSQTFSGHYSIATGLYPSHHGIVNNRFFDPMRREIFNYREREVVQDGSWYGGEPIWITAERQGVTTAAYFFPGTEAAINGTRPSYWYPYDANVPNRQRIETAVKWLQLPSDERPHLITLYFSLVDSSGHNFGADAPELSRAVGSADRYLGMLMDGIADLPRSDRVHIIVVSDHGMASVDAGRKLILSDVLDLRGAHLESLGPAVSVHVEDDGSGRRAGQVVAAFNSAVDPADARAFRRNQVPEHLRVGDNPRFGDVLLIPSEGVIIRSRTDSPVPVGTHGWDPTLESMHGIFVARGPGIASGEHVPPFELIHIYPFLALLLGVTPNPDIDGDLSVLGPYVD